MRSLRAPWVLVLCVLLPRVALAEDPAPPPGPAAHDHGTDAPVDAKAYAAALREALIPLRAEVRSKVETKLAASQGAQLERIGDILGWVSLAGLLLLLAPLWLRRKWPGRTGTLVKYSVLAAGTFVLAIFLFSVAITVLRECQHALGAETNPKIAIIEGTFDALEHDAEDLAPLGPTLIEPTLLQLQAGSDEPVHLLLLSNLQKLHQDTTVFTKVASLLRGVAGIMGFLPVILSFVAVALFLRNFLPLLRDIVSLPARAAGGEAGAGRRILGRTFRQVGRELLVILGFVGALLLVTIVSGFVLAHVVGPAMGALVWFLITAFLYLQVQPDASTGLLLTSLVGVVAFLSVNLMIVTAASVLFLGKVQKVLRGKCHDKVPLRAHRRFWTWGSLAFVWAEALPLLFAVGMAPVVVAIFERFVAGDDPKFLGALLVSGAILALGLPLAFWALRGGKALLFLLRYEPTPPADTAAAPGGQADAADGVAPRDRAAYARPVPTVELTSHLYAFFPQLAGRPLAVEAATVAEVVAAMERLAPGFAFYVCDEAGRLRQHVLVYVGNERVTDRATLSDPVGPDARVLIVQALSGG